MAAKRAAPTETRRDAELTQARILAAARRLFCKHGVDGTTVEAIARAAEVNKRMVYYYFGGKDDLYLRVLEETYAARRQHDAVLDMNVGDPEQSLRRLVRASFRYCQENPEYIKLLMVENLDGAKHLRRSKKHVHLHGPLLENLDALLERGRKVGVFRAYADPLQVYLTIASLCFFFHSNNATLSNIFGRDFMETKMVMEREVHIEEVVMSFLRPRSALETEIGTRESPGPEKQDIINYR